MTLALLSAALLGFNIGLALWVRNTERTWQRAYDYAVARADFSERGRAYSDMATVLVLAGDDPWPPEPGRLQPPC